MIHLLLGRPTLWARPYAGIGREAVIDMVPPSYTRTYASLAAQRPCGRAQLAAITDREACVFLACAYFLCIRAEQIRR